MAPVSVSGQTLAITGVAAGQTTLTLTADDGTYTNATATKTIPLYVLDD